MSTPTEAAVRDALREVLDPELGISVVDLGLVGSIEIAAGAIAVELAVTSPTCPLGPHMAEEARRAVGRLAGAGRVSVTIVRDPPWTPERMTDEARRRLGW